MPKYKGGYYTRHKLPQRKTESRIKLPPIVGRPVRFQLRSLIRKEFIHKNPWWFIVHRRGPGGRPHVGLDALEARAVPHSLIRGTLPERILYAALVNLLHMIPDIDFDFQTSLQGGRIQYGGIVVDFLFEHLKLAVQVQGPTHDEFIRVKKDAEQKLAMEEMGYVVVQIDEDDIYDEFKLEKWLRETFGWTHVGASGVVDNSSLSYTAATMEIAHPRMVEPPIVRFFEPLSVDVLQLYEKSLSALEIISGYA